MTSRTNGSGARQNPTAKAAVSLIDLPQRRQEAVQRYLNGDPIEQICQEMGCSKSWLYKWKRRYHVTEPNWMAARSKRPVSLAKKTPTAVEAEIIRLYQTLSRPKARTVSARMIRDQLRTLGVASIPSMRTIYRILNRHRKEVASLSVQS